jgi:hypothetical protein
MDNRCSFVLKGGKCMRTNPWLNPPFWETEAERVEADRLAKLREAKRTESYYARRAQRIEKRNELLRLRAMDKGFSDQDYGLRMYNDGNGNRWTPPHRPAG